MRGTFNCLNDKAFLSHTSVALPRLEAACRRALHFGTTRYKSLESILKNGLDREPLPQNDAPAAIPEHANVRGADYYH